jgi:hypothetical protein
VGIFGVFFQFSVFFLSVFKMQSMTKEAVQEYIAKMVREMRGPLLLAVEGVNVRRSRRLVNKPRVNYAESDSDSEPELKPSLQMQPKLPHVKLQQPKQQVAAPRYSRRLVAKPRKNYAEESSVPSISIQPIQRIPVVVKAPWNTNDVQDVQTLSTFPTYRELFHKYNLPISLIHPERNGLGLDDRILSTSQETDYEMAVKTFCYLLQNQLDTYIFDRKVREFMLRTYGLQDCATYVKTNTAPKKPTYDFKNHRIQFVFTSFDPKTPLEYSAPSYVKSELEEARKAGVSSMRKASFIAQTKYHLDKMGLIAANKKHYASEKEYIEAKMLCVQEQYKFLLGVLDVLVAPDSMRRFTLTSEAKVFELIREICEHPEVSPIIASETLFVLRTYAITVRTLLSTLEDST